MSKKRKILFTAATLVTLGGLAALAAGARHGGHHRGEQFGLADSDPSDVDAGRGQRRGWFARGPLSADEVDARIRERFARLDKNGDGIIDAAEIEAGLAARMATHMGSWRNRDQGQSAMPGTDLIRRFDENKDGKVTKEEFLGGIKRRFAEMDLNNDGRLSDDDLPPMMRGRGMIAKMASGDGAAMGAGRGRQHQGGNAWLQGVDVKDGAITLDAVLAKAGAEFDRLDKNKDGVIDTADFELLRKDMADYRVKRFLHMFGADKDGKITKEQFTKVAKERMARMDLDRDTGGHHRGRGPAAGERRAPDAPAQPKN
jgi:Ca2+-binding EF-hand superfamily protein